MIIAGTGHRPDKLGGYQNFEIVRATKLAAAYLTEHRASKVISGMAQDWDTALAHAALVLKLPLICAIPFEGQEARWPAQTQREYRFILQAAAEIHVLAATFTAEAYQQRNEWMVDRCDR